MELKSIYKADIDREINGVIKVAQNDDRSIKQELEEYIITRELRRHFNTFLGNYEKSLDEPTDKIGVWISGFFGSGKSHFLKILSYLLSNDMVAGKRAVDYFGDKFDDPLMFAQLKRCASVPTDTILFNIDSKSPINKDKTAILRVFAKVFYEYRGFYGDDLKVARLEQFIEKSGKTKAFQEKFQEINGDSWKNARDAFAFFEDDIVETLMDVVGMSETAARNWFNGTETADLSIEQLVKEIKEYVDSKGKAFRLLFMIDEVGQYIGSDGSLMLNLQTIVEEIGSRCGGRVWVMVTSQEAIDSITKISGDDFSKIQGRFNTRLSLSSSSVDEVIKKRILAKNEIGEQMLRLSYSKNSAVLKNLFTFNEAVLDLKGYSGEYDFVETYVDLNTGVETVVELPEVSGGTLVFEGWEKAGYVYGAGRSVNGTVGIYRLENKLLDGSGKFQPKNVEGLAGASKAVRDSLTAAFNYFTANERKLIARTYMDNDYSLYYNDLQNRGASDEISVAEVVGLFSGLAGRPVKQSLVICGRVVMSGGMMPLTTELEEIFVAASNAGAKNIMLPEESREKYEKLRDELKKEIHVIFYETPLDAAKKALGDD